ncbi:MAG: leucine-rich repeat domain-containing protein, partial [Synechococcus sp. SB0663_bin_10]|nr:leucine-rich repeat domain-containing protein [Synechococcus sp. SB0663_bin_10]
MSPSVPFYRKLPPGLVGAAPLAILLLVFSPSAHPQTQNICERLGALKHSGAVCNLADKGLTSLSSGDFDGLSNLQALHLSNNDLSSLPEDIFDGLSSLQLLYLDNNDLTSLPEDIFDGLSGLYSLLLNDNKLT